VFFPWICGLQNIMEGYLNYNDHTSFEGRNYIFYYRNLKEYEERIIYFINEVFKSRTPQSKNNYSSLKILLSIYLTHAKANNGMNNLTSKVLLRAGGRGMLLYNSAVSFIRVLKRL